MRLARVDLYVERPGESLWIRNDRAEDAIELTVDEARWLAFVALPTLLVDARKQDSKVPSDGSVKVEGQSPAKPSTGTHIEGQTAAQPNREDETMYQGLSLEEMARKVQTQAERKDDLVVDTRSLTLLNGSELHIADGQGLIGQSLGDFDVTKTAHRQIGERLGIPAKFADRLRDDENEQVKRLLDTNVNTLFREKPERRMVRTFRPHTTEHPDGQVQDHPGIARAFLSDSYRRRDNDELLTAILPILGAIPDVQFASTGLTESHFYLKAVAPRVQGEVKAGDVVQAGVTIRNSEVGLGSLSIEPFFYRLWCANGCGTAEVTRHYHVGKHVEVDEDSRVFADATLKLEDEAFFAKVGDTVAAAVDETRFNALLVTLREAAEGARMAKPQEAVERLSKRFTLTDDEGESVLRHLIEGGDLSQYGALNAVTRASHDALNYDRASELEQIGGKVLALVPAEWEAIAA
jgi:Domain of unknown function (DUF932)